MECENIEKDDNKDEVENGSELWTDDSEAKNLKEIVSIRSEESIAQEASEHIAETLERLNASGLPQATGTKNCSQSADNVSNTSVTDEKTELDRRVRVGEITPFQAAEAINKKSNETQSSKRGSSQTAGLLGLEQYLKSQAALLEQRKKLKDSKAAKSKELSEKSEKTKRKSPASVGSEYVAKKRAKVVASTSASDESPTIVDQAIEKTDKNSINNQQHSETRKTSQRKRSRSSEAESHGSESEYVPSEGEAADSDVEIEKRKAARATKKKRKKGKNPENVCTAPGGRRIYDDGDEEMYQERMEAKKKKKTALFTVDNLFKVPKFIWKRLYEYQRVSVRWLWELHGRDLGGLLGDEMGLGKTVQVIAFLAGLDASELLSDGGRFRGLGPTLIVCPATLLEQWVKHFQDWCPTLRVVILHHSGTYRGEPEDLIESIMRTGGIVLTSYSGVLGHRELLVESQWHYVILDEGHKIRNPEAKVSKAVKSFSTPHRLLLTGSPMQNSLKELWSLFDFILPGKLGTLATFLEHCANPITRGGYANASPLQEATALHVATMLKDAIAPYMLRRTKNDVQHHLNLPEKNEQVLFCSLTEEQTNLYKEYLRTDHVSSVLHDKSSQTENSYRARLLVALTTLRKICNHPDLYTYGNAEADSDDEVNPVEKVIEKFGDWKRSGKLAVVRSLLKIWKRQGHRVLLFTQGRQMMGVLEALVQREGYDYLRLDGTTPMAQRQHTIHRFNNDPSHFVFVSTTRVGGLGVNLTGANRVVIYDPDWNPAIDAQARERAWRIGQDRRVTIYRLITAGTVEEKIYHRQIFKVLLSHRILENPRQRRLFQTSDLAELFNLNEPLPGEASESDKIFSNCKLKPVVPNFSQQKVEVMKKLASSVSKKIEKISRKADSKEAETSAMPSLPSEDKNTREISCKKDDKEKEVATMVSSQAEDENHENISRETDEKENEVVSTGTSPLQDKKILEISGKSEDKENEVEAAVPSLLQDEDHAKIPRETAEEKQEVGATVSSPPKAQQFTDIPTKVEEIAATISSTPEAEKREKKHKKKREKKSKKRGERGTECSAIFEGEKVPCLIGRRLGRSTENEEHVSSTCDDDYVLMKLFAKTKVNSAYQHDAVLSQAKMGGDRINPMHRMARDAAEESMDIVRKSRKWCWRPTWDTPKRGDE